MWRLSWWWSDGGVMVKWWWSDGEVKWSFVLTLYWSCNFDVLLDLESSEPYLPTLFYEERQKTWYLPLLTITTFMTDKQTDRHGNSMTDPAQRAESVKILRGSKFAWLFICCSYLGHPLVCCSYLGNPLVYSSYLGHALLFFCYLGHAHLSRVYLHGKPLSLL